MAEGDPDPPDPIPGIESSSYCSSMSSLLKLKYSLVSSFSMKKNTFDRETEKCLVERFCFAFLQWSTNITFSLSKLN